MTFSRGASSRSAWHPPLDAAAGGGDIGVGNSCGGPGWDAQAAVTAAAPTLSVWFTSKTPTKKHAHLSHNMKNHPSSPDNLATRQRRPSPQFAHVPPRSTLIAAGSCRLELDGIAVAVVLTVDAVSAARTAPGLYRPPGRRRGRRRPRGSTQMATHAPLRQDRNEGHALLAEHPHDPGGNADKDTVGQQAARKASHVSARMARDVPHDPEARPRRHTNTRADREAPRPPSVLAVHSTQNGGGKVGNRGQSLGGGGGGCGGGRSMRGRGGLGVPLHEVRNWTGEVRKADHSGRLPPLSQCVKEV